MNKKELINEIVALHKEAEDWVMKLPDDVSTVFFDNTYADRGWKIVDLLIEEVFKDKADAFTEMLFDGKEAEDIYEELYEKG